VVVLGILALLAAPFAGCAHRRNPFDPTQNKPVLPGGAASSPGGGVIGPSADYTAQGSDSDTCVNGWVAPRPGTAAYDAVLRAAGVPSAVEVRIFFGPRAGGGTAAWAYVETATARLLVADDRMVARAPARTTGWVGAGWRTPNHRDAAAAGALPAFLTGCLDGT
jgi:hypothetical protein